METTVFKSDFRDINGLYEACEWCKYTIIEKKTNFLVFSLIHLNILINVAMTTIMSIMIFLIGWGNTLKNGKLKASRKKLTILNCHLKTLKVP